MGKHQRLLIFVIIGVLMISIVGTAILILADNGTDVSNIDSQDATSQQLQDIEDQLAQQAAQEELQKQLEAAQSSCSSLPSSGDNSPIDPPAFDLPQGDVTELGIKDLEVGTGKEAKAGDCVVAHYHGVLADGTVFDSSFERGAPSRFSLLRVIKGWQDGVPGMKEGGVRVLTIPSELAYGEAGSPPIIGPNSDLVFVVELVEVVET